MRLLIIGEAPGSVGSEPIGGRIGKRLAEYAGVAFSAFLQAFERKNVLTSYPGRQGKGARFDARAARARAVVLRRRCRPGRVVLLLGRRVATAFGIKAEYFEAVNLGGATAYVVPHPSGINRWYNDDANVELMRCFMRKVVGQEGA